LQLPGYLHEFDNFEVWPTTEIRTQMPKTDEQPPELWDRALQGDVRSIARCLSQIERDGPDIPGRLASLPARPGRRIIGITGPPGAGKSTLTDALIAEMLAAGQRVAVLCVDPSSPFHQGALLGDRIRMNRWHDHPDVYIRSLASRGALGGLHPAIWEMATFLSACPFDRIIIETVGVGQSEVDIAALADLTIVVLVPESGDEVQTMKAGLMEIADIFVVNKSDRPDADRFLRTLRQLVPPAGNASHVAAQVLATVADKGIGVADLRNAVEATLENDPRPADRLRIWTERAFHLIRKKRMKDLQKQDLRTAISDALNKGAFNLYTFIEKY
jgi:LAO/AO transport system kinase